MVPRLWRWRSISGVCVSSLALAPHLWPQHPFPDKSPTIPILFVFVRPSFGKSPTIPLLFAENKVIYEALTCGFVKSPTSPIVLQARNHRESWTFIFAGGTSLLLLAVCPYYCRRSAFLIPGGPRETEPYAATSISPGQHMTPCPIQVALNAADCIEHEKAGAQGSGFFLEWLGQRDSNPRNWHQKPGSCRWTMPQRALWRG